MSEHYARIDFNEAELSLVKSAVGLARDTVFTRFREAHEAGRDDETKFYRSKMAEYDRIIDKLDQPALDDTSQDAEPDDDD